MNRRNLFKGLMGTVAALVAKPIFSDNRKTGSIVIPVGVSATVRKCTFNMSAPKSISYYEMNLRTLHSKYEAGQIGLTANWVSSLSMFELLTYEECPIIINEALADGEIRHKTRQQYNPIKLPDVINSGFDEFDAAKLEQFSRGDFSKRNKGEKEA